MEETEMPDGYFQARNRLADELLQTGAVQIAAPLFVVDPSKFTEHVLATAARCLGYIQLVERLPCDAVFGRPHSGEPLAEAFAHCTAKDRVEMHIRPHGRRCIAEVLGRGFCRIRKVLVVNDQVRSGKQILQTVQSLREAEIEADHVLTLFDWERGARDMFKKENVTLRHVFGVSELLDNYVTTGRMSHYERASIQWRLAYAI